MGGLDHSGFSESLSVILLHPAERNYWTYNLEIMKLGH